MSFLNKLGDALSDAASSELKLGENTNKTINLGSFGKQVDKSAERRYVEEGYLRKDPFNASPKQLDILIQEPSATILVKKKMFSSIGENFRPDFMDAEEKLYYKTIKVLFQNKCNQISALEKLSKIQKISEASGTINQQLMPIIFGLSDVLSNGFDKGNDLFGSLGGGNAFAQQVGEFGKTISSVKKIYAFNQPSLYTSWITDSTNLIQSQFGQGTGVIEVTNFTSFNTTTSIDLNPGTMNLSISDPYQAMVITEYDIEKAISDANNFFNNSQLFQFSRESSDDIIEKAKAELNQVRALRKAGPISFKANPDTLVGKRLTAILDAKGIEIIFSYDETGGIFPGFGGASNNSVKIDPGYIKNGTIAGFEGLDPFKSTSVNRNKNAESEVSIFNRLVTAIYNKMQLEANSKNAMIANNESTNGIRQELRFNFLGKLIIQEQDPIHVYINSKSRYDNKILAGLNSMMSGVGIYQNVNKTITDLTNTAESLFNPSNHIPTQIEKSIYVGDDFPNYLWNMLRDQFVTEKEGTHVYAGIVESASDTWSSGKFTVSITASDNAKYFEMGKINFQPGADTYNGSIYDPLTPFKSNFDDVGGWTKNIPKLLDENKSLLDIGILKKKLGPNAGDIAKSDNIVEDSSIDKNTGLITRVAHLPDGLSYKWKKGIGVFTQYSRSLEINDPDRTGSPNLYQEPFAGLDVMNTISLLITGVPYNFETYYNAGVDSQYFAKDPQSKQNSSNSFLAALKNSINKSNSLWGNFIPFKNLVVDEKSYENMMNSQFSIDNQNADIEIKIKKLSDLNNAIALAGAINILSEKSQSYDSQFADLKEQAKVLAQDIKSNISAVVANQKQINADVTKLSVNDHANSDEERRFIRKKMNMLTRRMSYDVRANTDKNLFIVDDNYDKDYDIMAYNKALASGMSLMDNNYTDTSQKIKITADLLNMEVFCDTQGHIRARFPQYNRMPSSVFYNMMRLKNSSGIQIYPKFLGDFFQDQISALKTKVEVVEDKIRLFCALLGENTDEDAIKYIKSGNNSSGTGEDFNFVSNSNGTITSMDDLLKSSNAETSSFFGSSNQSINNYQNILNQATSSKAVFSSSNKYSAILETLSKKNSIANGINPSSNDLENLESNSIIKKIILRIQVSSNEKINLNDYIVADATGNVNVLTSVKRIDIFEITKKLQEQIKARQSLMKVLYGTIKNSIEYKSLDADSSTNKLLPSGNFGNSNIPEAYEHMIEDESFDDLGFGSGKRFILKSSQIINLSIRRQAPEYTSIQVQGIVSDYKLSTSEFDTGADTGNTYTTATAVDYDSWRTYGFKSGPMITLPFLQDVDAQCAPYASMLLSRARQNTLVGSVEIAGNEYMQPGEVIYLEDRGLLFYVRSVSHNFSYGNNFTTSLELNYGHTPGEYIPTFVDVIGKILYKNRDVANISIQRQNSFLNETNLGSLTYNSTGDLTSSDIDIISNMMFIAKYKLAGASSTSTDKINLEFRIYYDQNNLSSTELDNFANKARNIIIGKEQLSGDFSDSQKDLFIKPIDENLVKVVHIDLGKTTNPYSPSQKAMSSAKDLALNSSISISGNKPFASGDKIKSALYSNVVDCFISIKSGNIDNAS